MPEEFELLGRPVAIEGLLISNLTRSELAVRNNQL